MDKLIKFINKLNQKDKEYLLYFIFPKIRELNLEGLKVKPLNTKEPQFAMKYKKVRIVYRIEGGIGKITKLGFRKDVYRDLK